MSRVQSYDPEAVETKWQERWEHDHTNEPDLDAPERPFYNLMMFPYPSAEGLHVGNVYAYTGADVHGRWRRLQGDTVFQPIGFDAFGIHSENHALHVGEHPSRLVPRYVATFLVVGADHPQLEEFVARERRAAVSQWRARLPVRTTPGRADPGLGIELGSVAVHPLSGERLPVWAAPYVAGSYSSGVVMAVPAHDERDRAFATAHGLRVMQVVTGRSERAIEAVTERL